MIKRSRLISAVLLLLLSLACFISAPVFAEGPWDGDEQTNGDDGGGITTDTIIVDDSDGDGVIKDIGQGDGTDWDWVILKSIIRIIFISVTQGSTASVSVN